MQLIKALGAVVMMYFFVCLAYFTAAAIGQFLRLFGVPV